MPTAAQYAIQSSEATLNELRTSLRRTTLYAPMGGVVSLLNVEQGERVVGTAQMSGTELMRIADLNAMEVRVEVSENDVPSLKLGDRAEIEVDAYLNRTFAGTVTQIANSSTTAGLADNVLNSDQVTNFEVRISIDPESYADLVSDGNAYPFRPACRPASIFSPSSRPTPSAYPSNRSPPANRPTPWQPTRQVPATWKRSFLSSVATPPPR